MGSQADGMMLDALQQSQVCQYSQSDEVFECQVAQGCWALSPLEGRFYL
jgi:hypothetical protein